MLHSSSPFSRRHKKDWYSKQSIVSLKLRLLRISLTLVFLICCHIVAMLVLESMTLWEAIWLTLTTITTVGYGDIAA